MMNDALNLTWATPEHLDWAQRQVTAHHYRHAPVPGRARPGAYIVWYGGKRAGCLIFGRTQATCCYQGGLTYGSLADVAAGRAEFSRWEVLNLARVWLDPRLQAGGVWCGPHLPGNVDRVGRWHSQVASTVIGWALERVGLDYLLAYPPCFLDEPYELRCISSYCDTTKHRGGLYAACGFQVARINAEQVQTWVIPARRLCGYEHALIADATWRSARSQQFLAERYQLRLVA